MKKKNRKKLEALFITGIIILAFLLWDTILIYPVKIFVVLLHEISHGIAAILTGGKLQAIAINEFLGGSAWTSGGNIFIVSIAGYLGSLLFGMLLFISAYDASRSKWLCSIIAILLAFFAFNFIDGLFGAFVAFIFSVILYWSPRIFNKTFHLYLMKTLGLLSSLYVFIDIKRDLITTASYDSDAQIAASITQAPPLFWGFLWLFISVAVIIYLFKFGYSKGS